MSCVHWVLQGWLLCDDQSCCYRTRQPVIILEDSTPQCTNCGQGKLREEVSCERKVEGKETVEREGGFSAVLICGWSVGEWTNKLLPKQRKVNNQG